MNTVLVISEINIDVWNDVSQYSNHIHPEAFNWGYNSFLYGDKFPIKPTPAIASEGSKRLNAIRGGNLILASKIEHRLKAQGIGLTDIYDTVDDTATPIHTTFHKTIQAANPYPQDTLLYKEWERGYSAAYFNNLRRLHRKEKHEVVNNPRGHTSSYKPRSREFSGSDTRIDVQAL